MAFAGLGARAAPSVTCASCRVDDRSQAGSVRSFLRRQGWVWLAPAIVFALVLIERARLAYLVAALVGVGYLFGIQRRPATAVSLVLVLLVFNTLILALLLRAGLSPSAVRALGFWKEGIVAGTLLAALRTRPWRNLCAIDFVALAYIALGSAYLLFPHFFVGDAIGSTVSFPDRLLGWRSDVFYVLIFMVFRHLRLDCSVREMIFKRVLVVATLAAVAGIFESAASGLWNHLAVSDFGIQNYRSVVLHQIPSPTFNLDDVRVFDTVAGHRLDRIGSVLFDYLGIGFVFVVGLGVAAELVTRGGARRWVYVSLPVLGVALLLTQTRSAILAGLLTTLWALHPRPGKALVHRARFARVLAVVLVAGLPLVVASGAFVRFSDTGSNAVHQHGLQAGISIMTTGPLGRGLSTAAGGGQIVAGRSTSGTNVTVVTETQYLQVGTQLGFVGLFCYLSLLLLLMRMLLHVRPGNVKNLAPAAMANIAIGTLLGAIFTQPFAGVEVAWIFWGLAGLATNVMDTEQHLASKQQPTETATMRLNSPT